MDHLWKCPVPDPLELSTLWHTRYILRFFTLLYHLTCTSASRDSWHKGALPFVQQYDKRCVHPPPPPPPTNTRLKHATHPALFNIRSLGKGWRVRKRGVLFKLCPGVSRHTQHTCHARESAQTQRFLFPADRRLPLAVKYRVYPLVRAY